MATKKDIDAEIRENPQGFDYPDTPAAAKVDDAYLRDALPDHVRAKIAERKGKTQKAAA